MTHKPSNDWGTGGIAEVVAGIYLVLIITFVLVTNWQFL